MGVRRLAVANGPNIFQMLLVSLVLFAGFMIVTDRQMYKLSVALYHMLAIDAMQPKISERDAHRRVILYFNIIFLWFLMQVLL